MKTTLLRYIGCIMVLFTMTRCSTAHKAPSTASSPPVLLGVQPRQAFEQPPFKWWFDSTYRNYSAESAVTSRLSSTWTNERVDVFMGTWCGDSRREVPRLLKVLDEAGIAPQNIRIICTKSGNPGHKTSPGREEQGLYIFRVPTVIVYRQNKELGRIVESPVQSLEKDLLTIVNGQPYTSQYALGNELRKLLEAKAPDEIIASLPQLAEKLKPLAQHEGELNTFASVLLSAGDATHAIVALRLNTLLFPDKPDAWSWLAEAYRRNHDRGKAMAAYARTLELSPGEAIAQRRLDSLRAL